MLDSITYSDKLFNMPITTFLACIGAALALGIGTALIFQFKTKHTALSKQAPVPESLLLICFRHCCGLTKTNAEYWCPPIPLHCRSSFITKISHF